MRTSRPPELGYGGFESLYRRLGSFNDQPLALSFQLSRCTPKSSGSPPSGVTRHRNAWSGLAELERSPYANKTSFSLLDAAFFLAINLYTPSALIRANGSRYRQSVTLDSLQSPDRTVQSSTSTFWLSCSQWNSVLFKSML